MKKFLFVLCLALLLTLVCSSALALDSKYKSNGKVIDTITQIGGKAVHTSHQMTITKEPTCTEGEVSILMDDSTYMTLKVDALHDVVVKAVNGEDALCEKGGTGIQVCKDCGAVDPYNEGYKTIPPTGHKYDESKHVVDQAETCTKVGSYHIVCDNCGKKATDIELSKGTTGGVWYGTTSVHTPVPGEYKIEKVQTCLEGGKRYKICSKCGEPIRKSYPSGPIDYDTAYEAPSPHSYSDYVVTKAATCKDGQKTRSCTYCGTEETVTIPGTGLHDWKEIVVVSGPCESYGGNAKAATTFDTTKTKKVCKNCGTEVAFTPTNYMDHHSFVSDPNVVDTPAGCIGGSDGIMNLVCIKCGGKLTKSVPKATSHNWGAWKMIVAPKNGENGLWERYCTNYQCVEKQTYVGTKAPSGAAPVATATANATTAPTTAPTGAPSGSENYQVTSWSFNGSGVSGQVKGNVTYRTPGLGVNVIIYTPTGTFLATSTPVNEDGTFSVSAGGAVYAVSIQLKDNNKTYQTDGKYV